MRSKLPNRFWLSLGLLLSPLSAQALSVTATGPYVTNATAGGEYNVYYPDTQTPQPGFYIAPDFQAYRLNFDTTSTTLSFTVSGADTTKNLWVVVTSSGSPRNISLGACNGVACTAAGYQALSIGAFTLALRNDSICALGTTVTGCTAAQTLYNDIALAIPGVKLTFVESTATVFTGVTQAEIDAGVKITVVPEVSGPDLTACPTSPGFFPGDGSVLVETNAVVAVPDAIYGSSSNFTKVWVKANPGSLAAGSYDTAAISQAVTYGSGQQEITGFENSVSGTFVPYGLDYGVQDSAGVILYCGDDTTTNGMPYPIPDAFATDIQGFLRESNCFVATASYRDGRAPGVMLLRNFRDEFLSAFELGRNFIDWYYANGPIAADWLIEHPVFRSAALMLLLPLQGLAWVALHPAVLFVPLFALLLLLGAFLPRRLIGTFFIAALLTTGKASAVDQPYIDSLISELPKEQFHQTAETPDPYIQSIKSKVGQNDDATGYSESLKKQVQSDGSDGYTERAQSRLPKTEGSAIEDYRKGKKLRANKGSLDTRSAFGFNIMAGATRTYSAGPNQDVAYETVYGNSWVPDFNIHYEWRPFTGDFIKKFGLYTSAGGSFTKAKGILNYQDTRFGTESRTEFKFIVLPVKAGLIYRFSMFDFMWPYFGGGPSMIGFIESRNDQQSSHTGYDFGYWFTGGVAFGLDWMSPKSSWDAYDSGGIKHTYFTIDYSRLESVAGGLVEFTVDGVQVGFTFEL